MDAATLPATPDEIDAQRILDAYRNISFSPEKHVERERREYVADVADLIATIGPLATTEDEQALFAAEVERYKAGYKKHLYALLAAKSRTASPMITGPANFPTARNQKRQATEHKRLEEFLAWREKARAAIRKLFVEPTAIASDDPNALAKVQAQLDAAKAQQAAMVAANKAARAAGEERRPYPPYKLTNNNANIKRLEGRVKTLTARPAAMAAFIPVEGDGWRVFVDDDRIQIAFDVRQSPEMTARLKKAAFKWSPTRGAWVRLYTSNAIYAARQVLGL